MTPLRDIAWAKLNLTLEVLGRRTKAQKRREGAWPDPMAAAGA